MPPLPPLSMPMFQLPRYSKNSVEQSIAHIYSLDDIALLLKSVLKFIILLSCCHSRQKGRKMMFSSCEVNCSRLANCQ